MKFRPPTTISLFAAVPAVFAAFMIGWSGGAYFAGGGAATMKLPERGEAPLPVAPKFISGTIITLSADAVVLKMLPSPDGIEEERHVFLTEHTSYSAQHSKDAELFAQEMAEYQALLKKPGAIPDAAPLPYLEKTISADDLRAGERVTITTEPGQGVRLVAARVMVQAPLPPPPNF